MGNHCKPCNETSNDASFNVIALDAEVMQSEVLPGSKIVTHNPLTGLTLLSRDGVGHSGWQNAEKFPYLLGRGSQEPSTSLLSRIDNERKSVSELEAFVQKRRLEVEQEAKRLEEMLLLEDSEINQRTVLEQDAKDLLAMKTKLDSVRKKVQTQAHATEESERISQTEVKEIKLEETVAVASHQPIAESDLWVDSIEEMRTKRQSNAGRRSSHKTVSLQLQADDKVNLSARSRSRSTPPSFSVDSARDGPELSARSCQSAVGAMRKTYQQPPLFTRRGVEIVLNDRNGEERTICMTKRPLGAKFAAAHGRHVKVSHVSRRSHAEDLGIEEGWIVDKVAGQSVYGKSFEEVQAALKDRTAYLPWQE